ncbi:MAG: hypothetical protein HZA89_13725 [Verrucomicrobia bacterium]|nr:hypothetical protein [Verrucomicrobiota bacterium]
MKTFPNSYPRRVVTHESKAVFLVGRFSGNITNTNAIQTNKRINSASLAKFDPDGNLLWALTITPGTISASAFCVAVNKAGECYISGTRMVRFGADSTPFVAKCSQDGKLIWVKDGGSAIPTNGQNSSGRISIYPRGCDVDAEDHLYVAGHIVALKKVSEHAWNWDPNGVKDAFLWKYDRDGNLLWNMSPGLPGTRNGWQVSVDNKGNPHLVGVFDGINGPWQYGDITVFQKTPAAGHYFHAKYDPDGKLLWVRQFLLDDFQFNNVLSVEDNGVNLTQIRSAKHSISATASKPRLNLAALTAALNAANVANARKSSAPSTSASTSASPPSLNMILYGDYLILYWPKEFTGYVLESCDALTPFQAWEAETTTPEVVGDAIAFSVPIDRAMKFYRLRQP